MYLHKNAVVRCKQNCHMKLMIVDRNNKGKRKVKKRGKKGDIYIYAGMLAVRNKERPRILV